MKNFSSNCEHLQGCIPQPLCSSTWPASEWNLSSYLKGISQCPLCVCCLRTSPRAPLRRVTVFSVLSCLVVKTRANCTLDWHHSGLSWSCHVDVYMQMKHPKCKWRFTAAVAKYVAFPGAARIFSTKALWMPVQTFPSISFSPLVHRLCRVMGRRSSLGLGKDFDMMSPWKGKFVPVEGRDSGTHMSCEATERPLWMTVIIWDDYMRWSQRGKGHSMLLRVDPDPGTQSVLCVTGETQLIITCSSVHRSVPSLVPRERSCFVIKFQVCLPWSVVLLGHGMDSGNSLLLL